jgi:hypothetical protein
LPGTLVSTISIEDQSAAVPALDLQVEVKIVEQAQSGAESTATACKLLLKSDDNRTLGPALEINVEAKIAGCENVIAMPRGFDLGSLIKGIEHQTNQLLPLVEAAHPCRVDQHRFTNLQTPGSFPVADALFETGLIEGINQSFDARVVRLIGEYMHSGHRLTNATAASSQDEKQKGQENRANLYCHQTLFARPSPGALY